MVLLRKGDFETAWTDLIKHVMVDAEGNMTVRVVKRVDSIPPRASETVGKPKVKASSKASLRRSVRSSFRARAYKKTVVADSSEDEEHNVLVLLPAEVSINRAKVSELLLSM